MRPWMKLSRQISTFCRQEASCRSAFADIPPCTCIYIYTHNIYISIHIYICIGCMPLRVLIACMATCVQSIAQKAQGHAGLCAPLAQGIPVHAVASLYLCEKKREREREREMKICARIRGSSYAWVSRWSSGRLPILQEGMPSESTVKANIISARTLGV